MDGWKTKRMKETAYARQNVKLFLCLIRHYTSKTVRKVEVYLHILLTSALIRCVCLLYTRAKEPQYPLYNRSGGPQSLSKNVCLCRLSNPDSKIVYPIA
jgi:hypothetical protein